MPRYMVLGFGAEPPESKEEGQRIMARWMAWFESLGDSLVDMGAPFGPRAGIGDAASGAAGYMMIEAANLEAAVALVEGSPAVEGDSEAEVLEMIPMGPGA